MARINYEDFTQRWLERAETNNVVRDIGDKFIALWVAFNGWMKARFGEARPDRGLIDDVKKLRDIENVFNDLGRNNLHFIENLRQLGEYSVADMRHIKNASGTVTYDGTFASLIEVVYQIRCNLFHGRKDTKESEKDFELVCLAYDILLPLFKEYLGRYGYR